jgi:hypothetical protein
MGLSGCFEAKHSWGNFIVAEKPVSVAGGSRTPRVGLKRAVIGRLLTGDLKFLKEFPVLGGENQFSIGRHRLL